MPPKTNSWQRLWVYVSNVWIDCRLKTQCSCLTKSHSVIEVWFMIYLPVLYRSVIHKACHQVIVTPASNLYRFLKFFTGFLSRKSAVKRWQKTAPHLCLGGFALLTTVTWLYHVLGPRVMVRTVSALRHPRFGTCYPHLKSSSVSHEQFKSSLKTLLFVQAFS